MDACDDRLAVGKEGMLGVEPSAFDQYARRDETRREHASEIVRHLGLRTIRQADYRIAITAAVQLSAS